jgi:hypothetical protein
MAWTSVLRNPPCGKDAGAMNCSVLTADADLKIRAFAH